MSGQLGFVATDPVPPLNGPCFAAEDIDELGLALCWTVWRRIRGWVQEDVDPIAAYRCLFPDEMIE